MSAEESSPGFARRPPPRLKKDRRGAGCMAGPPEKLTPAATEDLQTARAGL